MRWRTSMKFLALTLLIFYVNQCKFAASYKSEIEITPSPIEEPTTKKGGFFSGFKNLFRGSSSTTTEKSNVETTTVRHSVPFTGAQKPPPLVITPNAPLQPLGPRPDTPITSPFSGNQHQAPQWPQVSSTTAQPTPLNPHLNSRPLTPQQPTRTNGPLPGFGSGLGAGGVHPPSKTQPSGLDLSYGSSGGRQQQPVGPFGSHLAPMTSTTTTTTTKPPQSPTMNIDLRGGAGSTQGKDEFPPLHPPRKSSLGAKEDFPALPTPKSPTLPSIPTSTQKSSLPSAWNSPNIPNKEKFIPVSPKSPTSTTTQGTNGVAFVPHTGTTVRPGFENTGNNLATDAEIQQLTENLYTKENSLLSHIRVNIQGKTRSIDSADAAPEPLLELDAKALDTATITKMKLLFNNYEADTTTNEHVTANEHKEENEFLDALMATSVMRQAMLFLQNKGLVTPDPKTHRDLVKELWFTQYSRGGGKIGSSGFEHVFVHEVKNGTIIGFHNWVYFAEEEKAGRMDYKGYLKELDLGTKGKVVKMRFTHNNLSKPVNGLFIGTSPELEMAVYTVCFKLRPDRTCPVSLGNSKFGVVTYSWRYRGKSLIGSAFPEI